MKATIVTPVWNQLEVTMDFMSSMLQWVKPPHRVLIVDNGSDDKTPHYLPAMHAAGHLDYVRVNKNRGFAGGNNVGLKHCPSDTDVVIFLSNDVRAHGDFVTPILETLSGLKRTLVGAKLLTHDTGWNKFYDGGGQEVVIPYLEGWCVAGWRSDVSELGGWDEQYFPCDYEDIHLCYQATRKGFTLTALSLPLTHHSGQTGNQLEGGRLAVTLANRVRFMEKWALREKP